MRTAPKEASASSIGPASPGGAASGPGVVVAEHVEDVTQFMAGFRRRAPDRADAAKEIVTHIRFCRIPAGYVIAASSRACCANGEASGESVDLISFRSFTPELIEVSPVTEIPTREISRPISAKKPPQLATH